MCGILALISGNVESNDAAVELHDALYALQHRGQVFLPFSLLTPLFNQKLYPNLVPHLTARPPPRNVSTATTQDACGIATSSKSGRIYSCKGKGLASKVFRDGELIKELPGFM